MKCPWCHVWQPFSDRLCRKCSPKAMARVETLEKQRNAYCTTLRGATRELDRLDHNLAKARALLQEVAELFKRGRYPRPLSNRITAFLEGIEDKEDTT